MELLLKRQHSQKDHTHGDLFIDSAWACHTLEDEYRKKKVRGSTRIPAGRYRIAFRNVGGFDARYAKRFPDIHRGMLHIQDVPGFKFILMHCGNDHEDTDGCPLLGLQRLGHTIGKSSLAYVSVYPVIADALEAGKEVWIEIVDAPGDVPVDA